METDKNSRSLVKHLKTLGQKIRIDVLKRLANANNPLSYSQLQKEVLKNENSSVNFSFHLNALKKCSLISNQEEGYLISKLGKSILDSILAIEHEINKETKTIMIRTSKYSKEPFDVRKIESYLQREGKLESYLARNIAKEVKQRLLRTKIEYLTAPLMREYINGILLEKGLEEVRHKLTRLGTPPYEVSKLFSNSSITPESLIHQLGSDVSEQYLLLNLLPKELADLYLSGQVSLIHLNSWSTRPLAVCLNSDKIFDYLYKQHSIRQTSNLNFREVVEIINDLGLLLTRLSLQFSGDIFLRKFQSSFLKYFEGLPYEETISIVRILLKSIRPAFFDNHVVHPRLSFEFNAVNNAGTKVADFTLEEIFNRALTNLNLVQNPNFVMDYSQNNFLEASADFIKYRASEGIGYENLLFYDGKSSNSINSYNVKTNYESFFDDFEDILILDTIFINLHSISESSAQDDGLFLEILRKRIEDVIRLFELKTKFLKKREYPRTYGNIIYTEEREEFLETSVKAISFMNLDSAITYHCGIAPDLTENSERFAVKVLKFMKNTIKDQSREERGLYLLCQPHEGNLSNMYSLNQTSHLVNPKDAFRLIRSKTSLSLDRQIELYKKFEKYINGGSIFQPIFNPEIYKFENLFEMLINAHVRAFKLNFINN